MTSDWDVIVIGAGPGGSVAARQTALLGRRVLLLDKKHFPRRKVCGGCLNHSAVALLEQIGLGDAVRECRGPELTRFEVRVASRRLSLSLPSGRAVSRMCLDQRLVEEAIRAGVTFRDGVNATVGASHADGRYVQIRDSSPNHLPGRGQAPQDSVLAEEDVFVQQSRYPPILNSAVPDPSLVSAKVVLVADGLGHPSLSGLSEIIDRPMRNARVGAGCEVREWPSEYSTGTIHMAVGRGGYVGLVCVENGALNVAGAFDVRMLREAGGPARAAASVLTDAGFPAIPALSDAEWIGTPALTRATWPVAAERLFVLGDAAGYVEPFTGEGIGWALSSAVTIAPLANAACTAWSPSLADVWSHEHARRVRNQQHICRTLAGLLRSPTCVRFAMFLLPWTPRLLRSLVRGVSLPQDSQFDVPVL